MNPLSNPIHPLAGGDLLSPYVSRLRGLFDRMDRQYAAASTAYGFFCRGCDDNCCRTRFYHHTLIECHYVRKGVERLSTDQQRRIRHRARMVDQIDSIADRNGRSSQEMCPLNIDGSCVLYAHRPMICRLHGIPHELHPPGKDVCRHPGCNAFYDQCRGQTYFPFDRTPFYREMSMLERDVKAALGVSQKVKMTVARMLLAEVP